MRFPNPRALYTINKLIGTAKNDGEVVKLNHNFRVLDDELRYLLAKEVQGTITTDANTPLTYDIGNLGGLRELEVRIDFPFMLYVSSSHYATLRINGENIGVDLRSDSERGITPSVYLRFSMVGSQWVLNSWSNKIQTANDFIKFAGSAWNDILINSFGLTFERTLSAFPAGTVISYKGLKV